MEDKAFRIHKSGLWSRHISSDSDSSLKKSTPTTSTSTPTPGSWSQLHNFDNFDPFFPYDTDPNVQELLTHLFAFVKKSSSVSLMTPQRASQSDILSCKKRHLRAAKPNLHTSSDSSQNFFYSSTPPPTPIPAKTSDSDSNSDSTALSQIPFFSYVNRSYLCVQELREVHGFLITAGPAFVCIMEEWCPRVEGARICGRRHYQSRTGPREQMVSCAEQQLPTSFTERWKLKS